jgi:ArsR family transcriptional regulator
MPVKHSKKGIFQKGNINHTAVFASLSNETRLRCLDLAARHEEVCVCEVVDALGIPQPTISKAFKTLREAGLVTDRRDASWTYYRLNDAVPEWLADIVRTTIDDLSRSKTYIDDEYRFERSGVREAETC